MDEESGIQCQGCGWRFRGLIDGYCLNCHRAGQEGRERDMLVDYVRQHPMASLATVAAETGVRPARIAELIAEGRLHHSDGEGPNRR